MMAEYNLHTEQTRYGCYSWRQQDLCLMILLQMLWLCFYTWIFANSCTTDLVTQVSFRGLVYLTDNFSLEFKTSAVASLL